MKTNHKIVAMVVGIALLVASGVAISFRAFSQIVQAAEKRKDTFTLLIRADNLLSSLKDAETGQRGFSITGQETFLDPYLAVRDTLDGQLDELRRMTKLSAGQKHIDTLAPLIDAKLAELARMVELRRKNDMTGVVAAIGSGEGKRLMDSIRAEMSAFIHLEEIALTEREARFQSTMRRLFTVIVTASVFALLLTLSLVYFADRESRQRLRNQVHLETMRLLEAQQETSKQLRQSNATLLVSEKELTRSLKANGDLKAALDEHAIVDMTDPQGKITFVNDKFCAISKYSRAELLGQDHRILSSGYHTKEFIRELWSTIASGRVWRGEIKNKAKDGTFYWLDSTIVPFFDEQGKIRQYVAIRADVTERKRHEAAVAQLAAIVTSSDDAIIGTDLQGVVTSWNAGAEKEFGYTAHEMIGQPITRLIPPNRQQEEVDILNRIGLGKSVRHFDTVRLHKDGRAIDVSVTVSPIKDVAGKIVGASKLVRDITEQKRSEAAVRDSEERFRTMANSMSQLAWIARPDGFIFWYNHRWYEYTGKTPEEMEGWGWQSVYDPVALPQVMVIWKAAIAAGTSFEMEFPLRGADGSFRSFLTRGEPLKNGDGHVVQWFGTNTDVTALKQAEENVRQLNADLERKVIDRTAQLDATNKELEAFSYSVAHDLRAPLRSIDGFSQLVLEDFGPKLPEQGQRYLQKVRTSAQTMGALIEDLLALARINRQELNKQTINTDQLVRKTLAELGSPWRDRVVEVSISNLPASFCDPTLMKQVWINLLSNALKYSRKREKSEIEIGCSKINGADTFFVRDNGTGFDMRYVEKLFGAFQRLHSADDFEGTGIGLAIVQRIILRHGGRVWADAAVDHGATFSFTLEKEIPL